MQLWVNMSTWWTMGVVLEVEALKRPVGFHVNSSICGQSVLRVPEFRDIVEKSRLPRMHQGWFGSRTKKPTCLPSNLLWSNWGGRGFFYESPKWQSISKYRNFSHPFMTGSWENPLTVATWSGIWFQLPRILVQMCMISGFGRLKLWAFPTQRDDYCNLKMATDQ